MKRVGWTRTHLNKAGLTERVDWGVYKICDEGKKLLTSLPEKLDLKHLDTIPRHKAWFHAPKKPKPDGGKTLGGNSEQPPNERIEEAFQEINENLASDLLERMGKMDPSIQI